jgi:hypothetical protein
VLLCIFSVVFLYIYMYVSINEVIRVNKWVWRGWKKEKSKQTDGENEYQ